MFNISTLFYEKIFLICPVGIRVCRIHLYVLYTIKYGNLTFWNL